MTAKGCDFRICFCLFLEIGLWLRSGNPEVWAQTGRSLRSAPMIAMRTNPPLPFAWLATAFQILQLQPKTPSSDCRGSLRRQARKIVYES